MRRLMDFGWDQEGVFRRRINRFTGIVDIAGQDGDLTVVAHVHDSGKLEELLFPGNQVALQRAVGLRRKTGWELVAARHGRQWVLVNSAMHRRLAEAIFLDPEISPFGAVFALEAEVSVGRSRLDFLITLKDGGETVWVEVKGCTLARSGKALFPDAQTERGRRHLEDLIGLRRAGARSAVVILVFRSDVGCFEPHRAIDPGFAALFGQALRVGVEVCCMGIVCSSQGLCYTGTIALCR